MAINTRMYQLFQVRRKQLDKEKSYQFSGAQMGYRVRGSGKPVILLHGSMIHDPWGGFEGKLAKYYQVYLLDLPGFGSSDAVEDRLHNTELFAEAFSAFVDAAHLTNAPVIAGSLGAVVAVKSAIKGSVKGKLILAGLPGKIESNSMRLALLIPVWIRRLIVGTRWGRDKILIPVLRDILGIKDNRQDNKLLDDLATTDTRSLVDIDVGKEVSMQIPELVPRLQNEHYFIYGAKDPLIDSTKEFVKNPIIVQDADHNVGASQPENTLEILRSLLG